MSWARAGDERGHALVSEVDAWMEGEAIADPGKFARMFAPGFLRRP